MTDPEIRAHVATLLAECITLIERLDAETLAHREWLHLFRLREAEHGLRKWRK